MSDSAMNDSAAAIGKVYTEHENRAAQQRLGSGNIQVMMDSGLDKAISLACAIAAFKTPEMEKAFARFLDRAAMNPILFVAP